MGRTVLCIIHTHSRLHPGTDGGHPWFNEALQHKMTGPVASCVGWCFLFCFVLLLLLLRY